MGEGRAADEHNDQGGTVIEIISAAACTDCDNCVEVCPTNGRRPGTLRDANAELPELAAEYPGNARMQ